jgi:squalene-hopene/tetraprenyl-beta-curcumene cyclase
MMLRRICLLAALLSLGVAVVRVMAAEPAAFPRESTSSADEPTAKTLSLAKSAAYLDSVAVNWTRDHRCGSCHTNYPYVLARPALKGGSVGLDEVRGFFDQRVANWDRGQKGDAPRWDAEVVATAATLALQDARAGKLQPRTRQALDRIWKLQSADGAWDWLKCGWPPLEHDDYYGAVYAAVGVGHAPDGYAETAAAKAGVEKLRGYLKKTAAPDLHHRTMLLWASTGLAGLMTSDEQAAVVKALRAAQRGDGGWALSDMGDWKRRDGSDNTSKASDGYATGLVVYVLRQAGTSADDPALKKAVAWLRSNQRESGRWFTRSLNDDKEHYISHAGTAYAVLALEACGALGD